MLLLQTSHAIATALNVVQTSHSYGDLMLLTKASEFKQVCGMLVLSFRSLYTVEKFHNESLHDLFRVKNYHHHHHHHHYYYYYCYFIFSEVVGKNRLYSHLSGLLFCSFIELMFRFPNAKLLQDLGPCSLLCLIDQ